MSKVEFREIRFQGKTWLLVGDRDGPITTKQAFRRGVCSYAHLCLDGSIVQFGRSIGTADDVEFGIPLSREEVGPIEDCALANLFGSSWMP